MVTGPVKLFPALPMFIVPAPLPQKLSPTSALPEITPLKMRLPLAVLFVMFRVAEPRLVAIPQVSLPLPAKVKSPPMVSWSARKHCCRED